jgi:hypothetical protein
MRRSLGALTLATALIAACGSQPATPSPSATAVPTAPAPTSTPTPTLGPTLRPTATLTRTPPPSPTAPPLAQAITLPTGAVRTLPTGTFALQGGRAFTLVGTGGPNYVSSIGMVNVATGTMSTLATRPAGHFLNSLTVAGDHVVWVEWWFAHPPTGCGGTGCNPNAGQPLLWQINSVSISTGVGSVIASGSNTRIPVEGEAAGPLAPMLAADGDRVAYTLDRTGPGGTDASAIIVRSLSGGAVLRRIDADGYVAQIVGLVGQAVFFREAFDSGTPGSVDPFDASLRLARSDGEPPRLIDTHVSHAAMDAQTLVWSREDAMDASIWTASLDTEVPVRVQGFPLVLSPGQSGPTLDLAVGSGVVAWIVWYTGADGIGTNALVVWRAGEKEGRVIEGQGQPDWVVIEDGSLVWPDYLSLPGHETHAVPISAISAMQ